MQVTRPFLPSVPALGLPVATAGLVALASAGTALLVLTGTAAVTDRPTSPTGSPAAPADTAGPAAVVLGQAPGATTPAVRRSLVRATSVTASSGDLSTALGLARVPAGPAPVTGQLGPLPVPALAPPLVVPAAPAGPVDVVRRPAPARDVSSATARGAVTQTVARPTAERVATTLGTTTTSVLRTPTLSLLQRAIAGDNDEGGDSDATPATKSHASKRATPAKPPARARSLAAATPAIPATPAVPARPADEAAAVPAAPALPAVPALPALPVELGRLTSALGPADDADEDRAGADSGAKRAGRERD